MVNQALETLIRPANVDTCPTLGEKPYSAGLQDNLVDIEKLLDRKISGWPASSGQLQKVFREFMELTRNPDIEWLSSICERVHRKMFLGEKTYKDSSNKYWIKDKPTALAEAAIVICGRSHYLKADRRDLNIVVLDAKAAVHLINPEIAEIMKPNSRIIFINTSEVALMITEKAAAITSRRKSQKIRIPSTNETTKESLRTLTKERIRGILENGSLINAKGSERIAVFGRYGITNELIGAVFDIYSLSYDRKVSLYQVSESITLAKFIQMLNQCLGLMSKFKLDNIYELQEKAKIALETRKQAKQSI